MDTEPCDRAAIVKEEIEQFHRWCGWRQRKTLRNLCIAPSSYYRWRSGRRETDLSPRAPSAHAILPSERRAVIDYALRYPNLRHRELAWRMIDEDVAYLSPSTVYRILAEEGLIRQRQDEERRAEEKGDRPTSPNERWQVDIRYVKVENRKYYLLVFIDEYSRYIPHHALLRFMDGGSVALQAQAAFDNLQEDKKPIIQSDNGSCFISWDFARVLKACDVGHHRIYPYCPEQNGVVERVNRTIGEELEEHHYDDYGSAKDIIAGIINWYNHKRLHSAIGFVTPADKHYGRAEQIIKERLRKLERARALRRLAHQQGKSEHYDEEKPPTKNLLYLSHFV
jgi:transposase InsO family protein